jgi:hypothetical protein
VDRASLYRLIAAKWLDSAEQVEHRALKRCYLRRALTYQTLAARYAMETEGVNGTVAAPGHPHGKA